MPWALLTADYTLTNTTSPQKFFNTTANGQLTLSTGVYIFSWLAQLVDMSSSSGNVTFDVVGAGTAGTDRWGMQVEGRDKNPPTSADTLSDSGSVSSSTQTPAIFATTGTGVYALMSGMFRVTTAGTIIPSVSLQTAIAATAKLGSYFKIERVGGVGLTYYGNWS